MKRKSRRRAQKQARQWTYYVEALKRSLDSLYEICRNQRNVSACREVILYLKKGNHDFESLIDSFAVENAYENGLKLQSVAWEIRQTGGFIEARESETESSCSMISTDSLIDVMPYSPALINDTIKQATKTLQNMETSEENGWQLVENHRSRRYSSDSMGSYTTQPGDSPKSAEKIANVYERLASSTHSRSGRKNSASPSTLSELTLSGTRKGYTTGRLLYPKSAMDLPQTRSSMAKIAYSRRILWEQHRSMLAEKMRKRQRQEQSKVISQRPSTSQPSHERRNRVARPTSPLGAKSTVSLELESIHEANEDEPLVSSRSEPAKDLLMSLSLDDDEEWRALTVEEESLAQEELSLKKEIEHEESTSVDAELRRQVEAEAAIVEALEKENSEPPHKKSTQNEKLNWKEALEKCTAKLHRQGMDRWNDAISKKITHFRPPGALLQMHEKLMSPSRQRCSASAPNVEVRLQRAEAVRQQLLEAKSLRLKELSKKVEHVKYKQAELLAKKRMLFQAKMEKAEQNRQKTLEEIVRKAHDDDQRVLEANFFKNMEESSARMLMELREGEAEARKQLLEEERIKRSEQNAANRIAAEKRREKQNEERNKKLQLWAERKRERQMQINTQRQEAERLRQEQSREKLEKYQRRLATIKANQISDSQKLLHEITRKQEECAKRHEESLEVVKKRAIDSTQGHYSNRSSTVSTYSEETSEPSESFELQFGQPPPAETRTGSVLACKSCTFQTPADIEAVAHAVFSRGCFGTVLDIEACSSSLFEVLRTEESPSVDPSPPPPEAMSAAVKKRRSRLRQRFLEICSVVSKNQIKRPEYHSTRYRAIKNISTKAASSLAKYAKTFEGFDSLYPHSTRPFSDSDKQAILRIVSEIAIALAKAQEENEAVEIVTDLWNKDVTSKLVKLLLLCNFSPKVLLCERALEVLRMMVSWMPSIASNLLHSSLYLNWMDCLITVTKDALEERLKASPEDGNMPELHGCLVNLLDFNSVLQKASAVQSNPLPEAKELSSLCIRYLSCSAFYSLLANYANRILYGSEDMKQLEFLLKMDSLIFLEGYCSIEAIPDPVLESDPVKPHVLTLFRVLLSAAFRSLDESPSSLEPRNAARTVLTVFQKLTTCYGPEALLSCLREEHPSSAIQFLHVLKYFIRLCTTFPEDQISMGKSLGELTLGMECLALFCSFGVEFQRLCALGHENSILYVLTTLDLSYYSNFALQRITAPPIIVLLYGNPSNLEQFEREMSVDFLTKFLKRIKDDKEAVGRLLQLLHEEDSEAVVSYFARSSVNPLQSTPT